MFSDLWLAHEVTGRREADCLTLGSRNARIAAIDRNTRSLRTRMRAKYHPSQAPPARIEYAHWKRRNYLHLE